MQPHGRSLPSFKAATLLRLICMPVQQQHQLLQAVGLLQAAAVQMKQQQQHCSAERLQSGESHLLCGDWWDVCCACLGWSEHCCCSCSSKGFREGLCIGLGRACDELSVSVVLGL